MLIKGGDSVIILHFKDEMEEVFEIFDLDLMKYFLRMEIQP